MATDEEILKLVLQIEGEQEAKKLAAAMDLAQQKYQTLHDTLGRGAPQTRAAAESLARLQLQGQAAARSSRDMGRAALEASRGLEDLQYGVAGVLNNIPSLISALGGSAGLAGAVSAAAVAGKILYDNWDKLAGAFGGGHVRTAAEEMEELRKKTELTASQAERLARADAVSGAVKELRGARTEAEQEEEAAATRAIVENGGIKGLSAELLKRAPGMVDSQGEAAVVAGQIDQLNRQRAGQVVARDAPGNPMASAAARAQITEIDRQIAALKLDKQREARESTAEQMAAKAKVPGALGGTREMVAAIMAGTPVGNALAAADPMAMAQKADEAARVAGNEGQDNRMAQFREDYLNDQAKRFGANPSADARRLALRGIAGGGGIDRGALAGQIGSDLGRAGVAGGDAEAIAVKIADVLAEETLKKIQDDATKGGLTAAESAQAGLAELDVERQKQQMSMMQTALASIKQVEPGRVLGSDEFTKNLMTIKGGGERDLLQKQIDLQQRIVAAGENTVQALRFGVVGRFGPDR